MKHKSRYLFHVMNSAFECLQQAKIFTKLDLHSACNPVRIWSGNEWRVAFVSLSSHYEYMVMPFDLMNMPVVFQCFVNEVFWETINRYTFIYFSLHLHPHRRVGPLTPLAEPPMC